MKNNCLYISLLLGFLMACKSQQVPTATNFRDDLSPYQVKFDPPKEAELENELEELSSEQAWVEPKPEMDITQEVDHKIEQMAIRNGEITRLPGYRVLIYSGRNRERARALEDELLRSFAVRVKTEYEQPNYKVKVGNYLTKIQAHSAYIRLREAFPLATVIQDYIKMESEQLVEEPVSSQGENEDY
ncbi:SPOR domain-containing protein [Rapidithrix thailandica]|uniref:SPOR domain-containing protein n=1 Tax=Rapidithrix thailandica TaxID=413964 RepID=A0AAW9RYZ8_9BACT